MGWTSTTFLWPVLVVAESRCPLLDQGSDWYLQPAYEAGDARIGEAITIGAPAATHLSGGNVQIGDDAIRTRLEAPSTSDDAQ